MDLDKKELQKMLEQNFIKDMWFVWDSFNDRWGWKLCIELNNGAPPCYLVNHVRDQRIFSNTDTAMRYMVGLGWGELRIDLNGWEDGKTYNPHKVQVASREKSKK